MIEDYSNDLQELGVKHNTAKNGLWFEGVSYLQIYDLYFRKFHYDPMEILEIGVKNGRSHRMWKEYFPHGIVHGIDINPKCKNHEEKDIHIEIGSQGDLGLLGRVAKKARDGFDIVLDDGSHINELTLKSFEGLWSHVRSGGYYVIEDLCNSYTVNLEEDMKRGNWLSPFQDKHVKLKNNRQDMDLKFQKLISDLDFRRGDTRFIHFWPMIVIIGKV